MKKIFIVDDQREIRELLELYLRGVQRQLSLFASGEAALEQALLDPPDVILLDVMMPGGLDGYEVARRLKAAPQTRHCPIIMLTAKAQAQDRADALAAGADLYISKPFNLVRLKEAVEAYLQ